MAKEWAKAFYNSKAWQQCKDSYIISVHGLCERCMKHGLYVPGKIVHHTILLTPSNINNPEASLNWKRLELLCQDCHNKEHHGDDNGITVEGLMFNEYGELVKT